jgi:hypothetical protein
MDDRQPKKRRMEDQIERATLCAFNTSGGKAKLIAMFCSNLAKGRFGIKTEDIIVPCSVWRSTPDE